MAIDNQQQARQATFLIIGQFLASLSEAVLPIVMVRFLSMTDVGILSAILLIYTLLAPVFATAFPHTIMYFLPTHTATERKGIAVRIALIMLVLGLVAGCIMFSLGMLALLIPTVVASVTDRIVGGISAIGPNGLKYLIVLALMPLGDFPVRMLPNLLVVEERARTAASVNVIKSLVALTCTLVPILLHCSLWVVVTSYSLAGLSSGLLLLYYLYRLYPKVQGEPMPCKISVREIFNFAIPMGMNETVMLLYNRIDLFLIALAFPAFMVGQYRSGAWQVPFVTTVAYSVGAVYAPHLRRLFDAGKNLEAIEMWKASIKKVALITVPLGLICIVGAEEIMTLLFTSKYLPAANVFRLYCLLTVGRVAAFGPVLVTAGQPRLIFRVAIISFIANIVFSIPLMLTVGLTGPALGTVLAFIINVAAFCWCIAKATQLPTRAIFPLGNFLKTLGIGAVACVPAVILKFHASLGPGGMLAGIAVSILFMFSLLGTVLGYIQREDWNFLARLLFSGKLSKSL